MHILWTYLRPHSKLALLALLLAAVSQVLALVDPIIFGKIIDGYALNRGGKSDEELVSGVLRLLGLAVVVAVLSRLAKALQQYVTRLVVQKLGTQIFNDGLRQVLRLKFQEFAEMRSGETLSLLQKVRQDSERFINAFINTVFASFVGVGFLVWYAVTKHWALVPVFLIGVLVLGGLTGLLSREIKSQQRSIVRETNRNSGFITESLRNIELIKSLGLTFPEIRRLQAQTQKIFALEMQKVKRIRLLSFLQGTTLSLLKLAILFALLWLIFKDVLSTGELIAMQFISVAIFAPLQELGNIILAWREAEASLLNFEALMKKPIERRPKDSVQVGPVREVRFSNVVFKHQSAADNALDGVSFQAALCQQLQVVARLDDAALFQHKNGLRMQDGGKPVCNQHGDARSLCGQAPHGVGDLVFGQRVQRRRGLVKNQQRRLAQQRAGNRQPLLFTAGQAHAISPMGVSSPSGALSSKWAQAACSMAAMISASLASAFTTCMFSRRLPANRCVSCVTKPIWRRTSL